jgi:hypothetical protein
MMEVVLILGCALWFQRRLQPPRTFVIVGVVATALLFNAIGEYRRLVTTINEYSTEARLPTLDEFLQIDFFGKYSLDTAFEARNAIYFTAATAETFKFNFGLEYWNFFVFRYVPGQFVGKDLKEALTVPVSINPSSVYPEYTRHPGTTYTGFADAFMAFAFLGALVYGAIARLLGRLWLSAVAGSLREQYFYCILITCALEAITHGTAWFVVFLLQAYLFSWPIFVFARHRSRGLRLTEVEVAKRSRR